MPDVTPIPKTPKPAKKQTRPMTRRSRRPKMRQPEPWSTAADLALAAEIVHRRSGGICEHCRTEKATNVHHVAGRGFPGCHHPLLLKDLCGQGNASGCHQVAHTLPMRTAAALGLRLPWGTRAEVVDT